MKVVQILAGYEDGGLEKHVKELCDGLVKKGVDTYIIAHKDFESDFKKTGANFVPLDLTKSRKNPFILYKLYKTIKSIAPDIIHTQANKATAMVSCIKPFLSPKHIATLHNQKRNLTPFQKADFVISVSDFIGKNVKNPHKKTIYNGINKNPHEVSELPFTLPNDKFIVCSIARFTKVKRLDLIIRAIKDLDVHLLLVGDGELMGDFQGLVSKLNIKDKVTFTGNLENHLIKNVLESSSLFVMSSNNEGFPYTFVESLMHKTPFISTPVSDMEKFLDKKYILPFNDKEAIKEKIEFVKENYDEVLNDFKPLFMQGSQNFTVLNMVEENIKVYDETLSYQR